MAQKKKVGNLPKVAKGGILTSKSIKKNLTEQTNSYLNKRLTTFIGEIATFRNKESGFVDVRAWTSYWNANHQEDEPIRVAWFERSLDAQKYAVEVVKYLFREYQKGSFKCSDFATLKIKSLDDIDLYFSPIYQQNKNGKFSLVGFQNNPFDFSLLKKAKNGRYGYTEYHPLLASKYIGWVDAELDVLAHATLLDSACGLAKKIVNARKRFNELFFGMFGKDNYKKALNCIKHAYNYIREDAIGINGSLAEDFVGTEDEQYDMLSKYKEVNLLIEKGLIRNWEDFKNEYRPQRLNKENYITVEDIKKDSGGKIPEELDNLIGF